MASLPHPLLAFGTLLFVNLSMIFAWFFIDPQLPFYVFDELGYTELARSLRVPLVNLHSGKMVEVPVRDAFAFDTLSLHESLTDVDLLCSVPMMKTHSLASWLFALVVASTASAVVP